MKVAGAMRDKAYANQPETIKKCKDFVDYNDDADRWRCARGRLVRIEILAQGPNSPGGSRWACEDYCQGACATPALAEPCRGRSNLPPYVWRGWKRATCSMHRAAYWQAFST